MSCSMFMCIMRLMVASWHPFYAKGCPFTTRVTVGRWLCDCEVKMWHSCSWAELRQRQTCTVGVHAENYQNPQVRVSLKLQGPFTNWKAGLCSVTRRPPCASTAEWLICMRGRCERNTLYFQFVRISCDWVWFSFLLVGTESWGERRQAVGLRKPAVHVINCGTDVRVPFSACSRWWFWLTVAPHHGQIKKNQPTRSINNVNIEMSLQIIQIF